VPKKRSFFGTLSWPPRLHALVLDSTKLWTYIFSKN